MKKLKLFGMALAAVLLIATALGAPQQIYKEITLWFFFERLSTAMKEDDFKTLYSLASPEAKRDLTFDEFVQRYRVNTKPYYEEYITHSYKVMGDRGIVDRTVILCTTDCEGDNRKEVRLRKEYTFVNGHWYAPENNTVVCERTTPYEIPEEFNRAISLIIQRLENSNYGAPGTIFMDEDRKFGKVFRQMRNCLNIQYAASTDEMAGAEGLFLYERGYINDEFLIRVSPDYSIKDDLVTAVLLRHELHHAYLHAMGIEQITPCLENEAQAFAVQIGFFNALNEEEQKSLITRYSTSQGIKDFLDLREYILINEGDYWDDKALLFVRNSKFYQDQCALDT